MDKLLNNMTLDEEVIEWLRCVAPSHTVRVGFSGGKDSVVLLDLCRRAGINHEAHYAYTPMDPPELKAFIKRYDGVMVEKPERSFIACIRKHAIMPTRSRRWCCEDWKHGGGDMDTTILGIRREESAKRSNRRRIEQCNKQPGRVFINPILDWTTTDVWNYIRERNLRTCELYREGWTRIGCVLCPMTRDTERQMARWPGMARLWQRAAQEVWRIHTERGHEKAATWQDLWRWWLDRDADQYPDADVPDLFCQPEGTLVFGEATSE